MMLLAVLSPVLRCEWGLSQPQVALITTVSIAMPRGYKTSFVLNSAEHEIYPAYNC